MLKILFVALIAFILSGCYSKCGFTEKYYCDCEEWYDAEGNYHKKCPDSLVDIHFGAQVEKNAD